MRDDTDLFDEFALAAALAPVIAGGMMIWWFEREWSMENPGFTVEQLRQLIAMRGIIGKILRGPNPEKEIVEWAMRGGKAKVLQLDEFRAEQQCERRGAAK
ncbi:hypothetical protein I6F34_01190 [Bradyrhizobium sp. BRP05]|nr:hypothetical protein [Bradyrhizobium sp. BRP05]